MAFSAKNYWEQQQEQNGNPPVNPAAPSRPLTAEEKTALLVQELVASQQASPTGLTPNGDWGLTLPGPNNMMTPGITLPVTTDQSVTKKIKPFVKPSPVAQGINIGADLGIGKLGDSVGAGAKDLVGGIGAIGKLVADAANEAERPESVEELYARLRQQYGGVSYNGPSGDEMAAEEFGPQFAILKQIAEQQKSRYNTGKSDIAGLYASMVQDATTGRAEDKAMYDAATKQINDNYAAASKNVSGNTQASNAAMAEELARLGQNQAIGAVSDKATAEAAKQLGYLAADQQTSANLNTQLGANEYSYDTAGIANTKQAGANSQQDLLQQYLDQMSQNDMQRLDLTGQQAKAGNAYDLQIQDMLAKYGQSSESSVEKMVSQILQERQQGVDNQFKQAGYDMDLAKFGLDQDRFNFDQGKYQTSQMDPYSALQARAAGMIGDPSKASALSQQIFNVYKNNPNVKNIGDFLRSFVDEGNTLDPATQTLASYFITQILKNQQQ